MKFHLCYLYYVSYLRFVYLGLATLCVGLRPTGSVFRSWEAWGGRGRGTLDREPIATNNIFVPKKAHAPTANVEGQMVEDKAALVSPLPM